MTETNGYGIKTSRLSPSFIGQPAPASDRAAIVAVKAAAAAAKAAVAVVKAAVATGMAEAGAEAVAAAGAAETSTAMGHLVARPALSGPGSSATVQLIWPTALVH